jgi:hypothetical protein
MTTATTPTDNVEKLFRLYGKQIRGVGSDHEAFINGLLGKGRNGVTMEGWRVFNQNIGGEWEAKMRAAIRDMRRDVPVYMREGGVR